MKIQEFRDKMKTADRAALEKIAAEMYRRLPKRLKEDELDAEIETLLRGDVPVKSTPQELSFPELAQEIRLFLSHVDADYYFAPNRVVPAKERPKWRFKVMRYLKQLESIPSDDENAEAAARLYLDLYSRLCYGCAFYIFPSEDPFRSILRRQGDVYPILAAKYFATGFTDEKILDMLRAATSVYIDRESLYVELELAFIRELRTRDMRERAFAIAQEEVRRLKAEEMPKATSDLSAFHIRESINEICVTIIGLGIAIYEEQAALKFYMKHNGEKDKEVSLYIALRAIETFGGTDDLWIRTFEGAVARGIKPRERLRTAYEAKKSQREIGN